jgi:hypothetical protein
VRLPLLAAWMAVLVGLLQSTTALAEGVALVTASAGSEEAGRYLSNQLDVPVVKRPSSHARDLDALVAEARAGWHEDFVVVLDADRAAVSVLRPSDGTMSSRALAPSAARAPYAVALAAVELLEIVRSAPPARSAALPSPAPHRAPVIAVLDAGLVQSVSANGGVVLLQPTLGVGLQAPFGRSESWLSIGVHADGLSPMSRGQVLLLPSGSEQRTNLEYARNEVGLRLGGGTRQGHAAVTGSGEGGLAFIDVQVHDSSARTLVRDRRTAFWLGAGGELRYSFWAGLAVGIGAGIAWFPVTSRFYASPPGAPSTLLALQEGALELRARAALVWELE